MLSSLDCARRPAASERTLRCYSCIEARCPSAHRCEVARLEDTRRGKQADDAVRGRGVCLLSLRRLQSSQRGVELCWLRLRGLHCAHLLVASAALS